MPSPEQFTPKHENAEKLSPVTQEQLDQLKSELEKAAENKGKDSSELIKARVEAFKAAAAEKNTGGSEEKNHSKEGAAVHYVTKSEKAVRYSQTLKTVQKELPLPEKTFSKVIHNPAVEKVSEATGNTLFRPNAILAAGICGFIISGVIYILARHFGYTLSGFETLGSLLFGFCLGLLYDIAKSLFTKKDS